MSEQSQFAAKVQELIAEAQQLSPQSRKRIVELLSEARKRIIGEISTIDPASYTYVQRVMLKQSIDQAFEEFRQEASSYVEQQQASAFGMGSNLASEPLKAAVGFAPWGRISTDTLAIAQGYTADLIGALSQDAAAKVNAAIQRAFLGGQSMMDVIEQVGKAIGAEKFTGILSPVGSRATTIAVNEIERVFSIASQARMEQLAQETGGEYAQKQWRWINVGQVPRATHQEISGQIKGLKEKFEVPNPVSGEIEELMFPRDPAGSPGNTINCHCISAPYIDFEALKKKGHGSNVLRDLGISVVPV